MKFSYKDWLLLFISLAIGGFGVIQPLHPWIGHALVIIGCLGVLLVLGFNIYHTRFKGTSSHDILSAIMNPSGHGTEKGEPILIWDLDAKVHINTPKPITIVFAKCSAELKHKQYKDIQSELLGIVLIEEDSTNKKTDVFGELALPKASQISIDKPSTVRLFSRFTTPDWKPGDKESLEILFELPVSERDYMPIKLSIKMSKNKGFMGFTKIT